MPNYLIRQHDTGTTISLYVGSGLLSGLDAAAILFAAKNSSGTAVLDDGAATVDGIFRAADGTFGATFHYQMDATASANTGTFWGQFKVTYDGGEIQILPGDESLTYVVAADYSTLDETPETASVVGFLQSQAAHGFAVADLVYYGASGWAKAQADAAATLAAAVVLAVPSSSSFRVAYLANQEVTLASHGLGSAGTLLYLSEATAGLATSTQPSTGFIQRVGRVKDANTLILWAHPAEPAA